MRRNGKGVSMGHFPFFMEIEGKKGVIAGGGRVAARKVQKLLAFGPALTVIAPQIEECMRIQEELLQEDAAASLLFLEREVRPEDLEGADFVIAATNEESVNGWISDYCRKEKIPVNVVDDKKKCTFFFPALVKDGPLTIGISTDGQSPLTAAWVRKEIAEKLPEGLGNVIDLMGQVRPQVLRMYAEEDARKEILERMFLYCMEKDGKVTLKELNAYLQREALRNRGKYEQNQDRNERKQAGITAGFACTGGSAESRRAYGDRDCHPAHERRQDTGQTFV